ncbi:T9SS C-terminal target domain-containing protein [Pseudoxanthomonas sp. SGD-10]|nr:T9SS C-terminal target domain-containing protein [Pseudoxanthomonas sp. SGD-10]
MIVYIIKVGVKEVLDLTLFPNPVASIIHVQHPQAVNASLRIFNTEGKIVQENVVANLTTSTSIDISTLNTGMYYLVFVNQDKQLSEKFIKK